MHFMGRSLIIINMSELYYYYYYSKPWTVAKTQYFKSLAVSIWMPGTAAYTVYIYIVIIVVVFTYIFIRYILTSSSVPNLLFNCNKGIT